MIRAGGEVRLCDTPTMLYRKRATSLSAHPTLYADSEAMLCRYAGAVPGFEEDVRRGLRRLRAEQLMIDASLAAADGNYAAARRMFVNAAVAARRFAARYYTERVPLSLRALAYAASPRLAVRRRERFEGRRLRATD